MTSLRNLQIDLIPSTAWGRNVREILPQHWDRIRRETYREAGHKCEICQGRGDRHPVEAHEIWAYDETTLVQRLDRIACLCPACHACHHLGREAKQGRLESAIEHLRRISGLNEREVAELVNRTFAEWERRSRFQWRLDLSWLREKFGIDVGVEQELTGEQTRLREEAIAIAAQADARKRELIEGAPEDCTPLFRTLSINAAEKAMSAGRESPQQIIGHYTQVIGWHVDGIDVQEPDLDLARQQAAEIGEERRKLDKVLAQLPVLRGSEKQIAWAIQIRLRAVKVDPENPDLRKQTTATWWIQRREQFAAPRTKKLLA